MDGSVLALEEGPRVCLELYGFVCMDKVTCIDGDEMAIRKSVGQLGDVGLP